MADRAEKYLEEALKSPNTFQAPSVLRRREPSAIDLWLESLMPRSPVDRRGPLFGVPPILPNSGTDIPTQGMLDPYHYGRMRIGMLPTDPWHSVVAPLEHREFVQEVVDRDPRMAVPMAGAIPAYSWLKWLAQRPVTSPVFAPFILGARQAVPQAPNTSPATLDEVFAGYEGLLGGLRNRWAPNS